MRDRTGVVICFVLIVLVLAAMSRVLHNDFVNYDDDRYVYENLHVKNGPTLDNLAWALTTTYASNWHPVTWISHMLDARLYGLNPLGHHLTSLLIHLANTLILFGLLRRMTGSRWASALTAALFGVHPLHVESVAWVSERKDVLCALFWLLATWAYVRYTERPNGRRYAAVLVLFALGLMSKPMIVTFPLTLLLLDYWPLRRREQSSVNSERRARLVLEKTPLFAMSAASCVITYVAQCKGFAVGTLERLPLGERAANAVVSYVVYTAKVFVPYPLAAFYPHPKDTLPALYVIGASVLLVGITLAAWRLRNRPYLLVGWLWYVVTLFPVIGLMQVGWQGMADRYTYVPLVGLFIAVLGSMGVWENGSVSVRNSHTLLLTHPHAVLLTVVSLAAVVAFGVVSWGQCAYWKDSITLFTHALRVTRSSPVAEDNLAVALSNLGKLDEAIIHHRRALGIEPEWADAHFNLGSTYLKAGRSDKAIPEFRAALRVNPRHAQALNNLGAALLVTGHPDEAAACMSEAVRVQPDYYRAYMNLATAFSDLGRWDDALAALRKAVSLDPSSPDARQNLGITLAQTGQPVEAIAEFREALRLQPDWPEAQNNLAYMLASLPDADRSDRAEAVALAEAACRSTKHRNLQFLDTLVRAYAADERFADAARAAREAARVARSNRRAGAVRRLEATARLYDSLTQ